MENFPSYQPYSSQNIPHITSILIEMWKYFNWTAMFSIYICVLFKSRKILWKFIVFSFIVISPLLFHYSLFSDLQSLFPNGFGFSRLIFAKVYSIKCEYLYLPVVNSIGLSFAKVVPVFPTYLCGSYLHKVWIFISVRCEFHQNSFRKGHHGFSQPIFAEVHTP